MLEEGDDLELDVAPSPLLLLEVDQPDKHHATCACIHADVLLLSQACTQSLVSRAQAETFCDKQTVHKHFHELLQRTRLLDLVEPEPICER
jgi:hypothetical protein